MAGAINISNVSQIPGNECLGESRERINYNIDLLKQAILELQGTSGLAAGGGATFTGVVSAAGLSLAPNIEFTGNTTTATSVTATNAFIEVLISGTPKYLRLFDI